MEVSSNHYDQLIWQAGAVGLQERLLFDVSGLDLFPLLLLGFRTAQALVSSQIF